MSTALWNVAGALHISLYAGKRRFELVKLLDWHLPKTQITIQTSNRAIDEVAAENFICAKLEHDDKRLAYVMGTDAEC